MVLASVVAVPLGVISAINQDSWGDYVTRMVTIGGIAIPNFWVAILMILFLVILFDWLPPLGYANLWEAPWTNLQQLFFPAVALGFSNMAFIARVTRSSMLEVFRRTISRTARSKGLAERVVISRHALKNAPPAGGNRFRLRVGQAPGRHRHHRDHIHDSGMGRLLIEATTHRDYPMIQAIIVIIAVLILVLNVVMDLVYAWLNPRIPLRLITLDEGIDASGVIGPNDPCRPDHPCLEAKRTALQEVGAFLRHKPLGAFGAIVAVILIVVAIFANIIATHDPYKTTTEFIYATPGTAMLFGGDNLGRDVFSRIVFGARISLYVGIVSSLVGCTIGLILGVASVHFGGRTDLICPEIC